MANAKKHTLSNVGATALTLFMFVVSNWFVQLVEVAGWSITPHDLASFIPQAISERPLAFGLDFHENAFMVSIFVAIVSFIFFFEFSGTSRLEEDATSAMRAHGDAHFLDTSEIKLFGHYKEKTNRRIKQDVYGQENLFVKALAKVAPPRSVAWVCPSWCKDVQDDNYILSKRTRLALSANKDRNYEINKHVYVMAGSGAGKTFNFVGSNVLQLNCSYVFTDPKGEILERYGNFLKNNGYKIKIVNIKDEEGFLSSHHYNPLHYVKNATAINDIVELLIENTSSEASTSKNGDFFVKAERQLYLALLGWLYFTYKDKERYKTIPNMLDVLSWAKINKNTSSILDRVIIGSREETEPNGYLSFKESLLKKYGSHAMAREEWFVVSNYEGFVSVRQSPETTASILGSCFVRLVPFAIAAVRNMFSNDNLELEKIGREKTALFIITSAQKGTYDFIAAMLLYQFFDICEREASKLEGRHWEIPVCCYLDEVANIGKIPGLAKQVAFLRSYWVNLIIIVQSEADLERVYGDKDARSIRNNCATTLYLGRDDITTCEKLSKELGMKTVAYETNSRSTSKGSTSYSKNVSYIQAPLMRADEIANDLDGDECLIHFTQNPWIRDVKADPREHPRWGELQKSGLYDLSTLRETNTRAARKVKPAQPFIVSNKQGNNSVLVAGNIQDQLASCTLDNSFSSEKGADSRGDR